MSQKFDRYYDNSNKVNIIFQVETSNQVSKKKVLPELKKLFFEDDKLRILDKTHFMICSSFCGLPDACEFYARKASENQVMLCEMSVQDTASAVIAKILRNDWTKFPRGSFPKSWLKDFRASLQSKYGVKHSATLEVKYLALLTCFQFRNPPGRKMIAQIIACA